MSHLKLENSNKVKSWDWFLLPFPKLDIWGLLYYYICTYMHACVSIKYQTFRIIYSKFQFLHKYISPHTHTHTHTYNTFKRLVKGYLIYYYLSKVINGLPFWVPDVLCQHSEVVLWNLFSVQTFFQWIRWGESGLPVLFLCHLRIASLLKVINNLLLLIRN